MDKSEETSACDIGDIGSRIDGAPPLWYGASQGMLLNVDTEMGKIGIMSTTAANTTRPPTERDVVTCDPDVVSGTPVFRGTRVPVTTLFDYLLHGKSLAEFYDEFPTVTQEHVLGVLRSAREHVDQPIFPSRERAPRGA